ncbi:bacteriohemerythrin [Congregibacter variabilis]|uniref:diguanylate cyclase n=1 Tax=Congregibacter variabilis TaxID=3081200 RepID=A0ABZ0I2C6_9GAMM|nr:bacteriohemerythrin [Congregibacter sp. IMCC43200]
MESFHWDAAFVTGLNEVDEQHHKLVDLINELGDAISADSADDAEVSSIIQQLFSYSQYHFAEEERMMRAANVDQRHQVAHLSRHKNFLEEVQYIHANMTTDANAASHLLEFLTHWLAYHILGSDQNLARQVKAIESGVSAKQAFEDEEQRASDATGPLLAALNGLFQQVSTRNRELMRLNQSLEAKVAERTRALTELNTQLDELANTDTLTQLPNRRHVMEFLTDAWQESLLADSPLACMMIDADHFKEINDRYGHEAGDQVLKILAAQLKNGSAKDDLLARLGGDEFLIICPNTTLEDALARAERLKSAIAGLSVIAGEGVWSGSVSIGVAVREPALRDHIALVKKADQSVYEAKRAGKSCVKSLQADELLNQVLSG